VNSGEKADFLRNSAPAPYIPNRFAPTQTPR
jgi:hypothetical protein